MSDRPVHHKIPPPLKLHGGRALSFDRPLVMGVLNVTPDSFSDGGINLLRNSAVANALRMVADGADIIDIGGESTRPGADPVPLEEERRRVIPVIEGIRQKTDRPISVDTYKATLAREALAAGADIINDISAFRLDPAMAGLVAELSVPVILMHMKGTPRDMQQDPQYQDCVMEIGEFFQERIVWCEGHGISQSQIILDPGIGFGKRVQHNLQILARFGEFTRFGCPLLVGASRKSFIAQVHPIGSEPSKRTGGSVAAAMVAVTNGAHIVRVHDVPETVEALSIWQAIRGEA